MKPHRLASTALAIAAAYCLVACDAQTDPSYKGEPLATIQGTITSEIANPPQVNATLLWSVWVTNGDSSVGVDVPVKGSFPSSFTMDLLAPPPTEALNPAAGVESAVGTAYITALLPGATGPLDEDDLLGVSEDHVLVYAASDIKPGTFWEKYMHGARTAGYHLMMVHRPNAAEQQEIDACNDEALTECNACQTDDCDACWKECDEAFLGVWPSPGGFNDIVNVHLAAPDDLNLPEIE